MNVERLELMATMLREVQAGTWTSDDTSGQYPGPRGAFNIGTWVKRTDDNNQCGFAACAVGHACLDARFNAQGLKLSSHRHAKFPEFNGFGDWHAVNRFFGLNDQESEHLFGGWSYRRNGTQFNPGPASVAQRVEAFIKRGGLLE